MMHGAWPFTYDVQNTSEALGICVFKKQFTDLIARPNPVRW